MAGENKVAVSVIKLAPTEGFGLNDKRQREGAARKDNEGGTTMDERMEFLLQSIESHDRQLGENASLLAENARQIGENARLIGEVTVRLVRLEDAIEKLVAVTNEDATAIRTLARIADAHERRISQIEEDR